MQTCLRSLTSFSKPTELNSVSGQIDIINYLAMAYVGTESFREAIKIICRAIFLNPTLLHNWFNLAYLREELAVSTMRKNPKSSGVRDAINELETSISLFRSLGLLLNEYNAGAHISSNSGIPHTSITVKPIGASNQVVVCNSNSLRSITNSVIHFDKTRLTKHDDYCKVEFLLKFLCYLMKCISYFSLLLVVLMTTYNVN